MGNKLETIIIQLQQEIVEVQLALTSHLEHEFGFTQVNNTKFKVFPYPTESDPGVGYQITIPEFLPRVSIYRKVVFKDRFFNSDAYKKARDHWYRLIRKAVPDKPINRIIPAIIHLTFYVPEECCDVDNFTEKFIIDGLMYSKLIGPDDNCNYVTGVVRDVKIDAQNPRTVIQILPDIGQLGQWLPVV